MIAGRRYVICGLSRLTTRVAQALDARQAEVVIIHGSAAEGLAELLGEKVRLVPQQGSREEALRAAGLQEASCLLALDDDDLSNLQMAVTAHGIAPAVPVVVRAFEPTLADQLEQGLNVRRAYSVSVLSAPTFVAAGLGEEVIETLRLGDAEVSIARLTIRAGSPLVGKSAGELREQLHCALLARAGTDGVWVTAGGDPERVTAGTQMLVGGVLADVLRLAQLSSVPRAPAGARAAPRRPRFGREGRVRVTWLPRVAAALVVLLALAVVVFGEALRLHPIDALYFVITTATTTGYGDISLRDTPAWLKLFGCVVMLSGGALLAILFSNLAAAATAERLEEQTGRRAQRLSGHFVVTGLGNVGYRVAQLLSDLEIDSAVVELSPGTRFVEAVRERTVVLAGDARLPENLERASIRGAAALLACTNDDLANIQTCLHARRLNPNIRTVARVFDDQLAEHLSATYQIDAAVSATKAAASAFVGAATDERALRPFHAGELALLAFRLDVEEAIPLEQIHGWEEQGLRVLAFRRKGGPARAPALLTAPLQPGDAAIVAGPERAVNELLLASEKREETAQAP
jgi:Trk K+ transport system NAD-binding subunit